MGLSWAQYNLLYYLIQYGLFLVIYFFLVICIPYDLMDWIAETILFLKDEKEYKSTSTCTEEDANKRTEENTNKHTEENTNKRTEENTNKRTEENTNKRTVENTNKHTNCCCCYCICKPCDEIRRDRRTNWCSCCCIWMPCDEISKDRRTNWCSCCCLWMPLDDDKDNKNALDGKNNKNALDGNNNNDALDGKNNNDALDGKNTKNSTEGWRRWCLTRWFLRNRNMKTDLKKDMNPPPWCVCNYIWRFFGKVFQCACRCCECCGKCHVSPGGDCEKCLINLSYCCCECDCGDEDLKNKKLPHQYHLQLQKTTQSKYCGFIYLNMNRIGLYLLLCTFLWCATVVFFEGIILGYATAKSGDICPTPKRATAATIVDCFIYQNAFDTSPINTSFPIQCNNSISLSFSGSSASCFAWIYLNVEVIDVIEELGICTGIVALLGTIVAVMSYLCLHHRWRFLFDIVAILAVAGIPILLYTDGRFPFMTYILLVALFVGIAITEYLMNFVPLLTGLCLANRIFGFIKYRDERMTPPIYATASQVRPVKKPVYIREVYDDA